VKGVKGAKRATKKIAETGDLSTGIIPFTANVQGEPKEVRKPCWAEYSNEEGFLVARWLLGMTSKACCKIVLKPIAAIRNPPTQNTQWNRRCHSPPEWQRNIGDQTQ
jgi:hypothetical protein